MQKPDGFVILTIEELPCAIGHHMRKAHEKALKRSPSCSHARLSKRPLDE
jgi:hypothetical protein